MTLAFMSGALEQDKLALSHVRDCVYAFNPLSDPRWDDFLQRHPDASVFHSTPWLQALTKTYGYEVIAYTTNSSGEDLENAVVFCRVNSWLTGRRLVSLPFSDHCEPLVNSNVASGFVSRIVQKELGRNQSYAEFRPFTSLESSVAGCYCTNIPYVFHQLDLTPPLETLFQSFHKSSIQRKIRRAESERLTYREGRSEQLLDQFFSLFQQTRKRHRIPPPPRQWFLNLVRYLASALKIRVAYKEDRPVAAMLTLEHKDTLVYKYGASNPEFHRCGAMHLLYWKTIQEAKKHNLKHFDLGRTDADQHGLITFKNRWGAKQSTLMYSRYSKGRPSTHFFDLYATKWKSSVAKYTVSCLPYAVVSKMGQMLYRHIA